MNFQSSLSHSTYNGLALDRMIVTYADHSAGLSQASDKTVPVRTGNSSSSSFHAVRLVE